MRPGYGFGLRPVSVLFGTQGKSGYFKQPFLTLYLGFAFSGKYCFVNAIIDPLLSHRNFSTLKL